jgi:Helix-turn-helix of DDE superfamily endonuclease
MLLRYDELVQNPERLLAWTGLNQAEIAQLLPSFEAAWEEHRRSYHRPIEGRKRAFGAGRPGQLHRVEDKLLFILVYFKVYPLQEVQGTLFGMGQSQAHEWIHRLTEVLQATLHRDLHLPARDAATLEGVLAACESHSFVIDGTERPTQRSAQDAVQREHYSGKKNAHA